MNKRINIFFLAFLFIFSFDVQAQINVFDGLKEAFLGGKADGYASMSSSALLPQMQKGGKGDGYALRSSVVFFDNPFYGGKGDGYAHRTSAFPVTNMYLGGKGDGYACCLDIGFSKALHPLPVELIFFHVLCMEDRVVLKWATASEYENNYFIIEKSSDAQNFYPVGTVPGAGTSSLTHNYSFIDKTQPSDGGYRYYRLKQTDYSGSYTYSGISYVHCNKDVDQFAGNLFPNPAKDIVSLVFSTKHKGILKMEITDVVGQFISGREITVVEGDNLISEEIHHIQSGLYFFTISGFGRGILSSQKFVKCR